MKIYGVLDMRKNMRKVLDTVDVEDSVFFIRNGKVYKIVLANDQSGLKEEYLKQKGYVKVEKWEKKEVYVG